MANDFSQIVEGIQSGKIVPYLGPGVLGGVTRKDSEEPIPADSDSLILAMTNGQALSPRLMYEFPRAAMHMENKKGRRFIEDFLQRTYGETQWKESSFHTWLAKLKAPYVVDSNRDKQLLDLYQSQPHTLVVGVARIAAHPYRFDIYECKQGKYQEVPLEKVNQSLPVIFKPLGCPIPKPSFVASDADFVDYITELMGGFAIPHWLKDYRYNKQYAFFGLRFNRDTERMLMSDITYAAHEGTGGWAFISQPTDKERRFLQKKNINIIEQDWLTLIDSINCDAA